MATAPPTSPPAGKIVEYEAYIDEQISKTSFHVKVVDLTTGLIALGLIILGSLLALVLIDHWIVGLGFWARLVSLIAIVGSSLFVVCTRIAPVLIRTINPTYAAQTVERSFPALKNGLVNFLFFREQPESVHRSVYQGMQRQAAAGLAEVPMDSAVDRASIIRLGYVLVAIAALWCAYIVFSPKSPLQTVSRVIAPWRDIARPSKVDIISVAPGDIEVFRGQTVEISAEVADLPVDALPRIEFSTADGQLVDVSLPMEADKMPNVYRGQLTSGDHGIQQHLEYRIIAGDAESQVYHVTASEAPHMVVDRVAYDYPSYTGLADEMMQGEGDIRAIEGTRVTIYGKANQLVRSGYIELLPTDFEATGTTPAPKTAPLKADGDRAEYKLRLRMAKDQNRSIYQGYRLQFVNSRDIPSQDAVTHAIEVTPDLRPVATILTPSKRTVEIPANGALKIEIRALDPDFQLTKLQFAAQSRKKLLVREDLISEPTTGQVVTTFQFVPSKYELQPGDVVEYVAMAEDNRHAALTGQPEPNRTVSSKQYIRITEPDPSAENISQESDDPSQNESDDEEAGDENPDKKNDGDSNQQESGNKPNNSSSDQPQQDRNDGQPPKASDSASEDQPGESGESGDSEGEQGLQQSGKSEGDQQRQELESGEQGNDSSGSQDDGSKQGGDQDNPNGGQSESDGSQPDGGKNKPNSDGKTGESRDELDRGIRPDAPPRNDGTQDGDIVDRIKEHMEEKGEGDPDSSQRQENADSTSDPNSSNSRPDDGKTKGEADDEPSVPEDKVADGEAGNTNDETRTKQQQQAEGSETSQGSKAEKQDDGSGASPENKDGTKSTQTPSDKGGTEPQADNASDSGVQPQPDSSKTGEPQQPDSGTSGDEQPADTGETSATNGESGKDGDHPQHDDGKSDAAENASQEGDSGKPDGAESDGKQKPGQTPGQKPGEKPGQKPDSQSGKPNDNQSASDQSGEPSGDNQQGDSTKANDDASQTKSQPGKPGPTKGDSSSQGAPGAKNSDQGGTDSNGAGDVNGTLTGDDPNLDYAKKTTDLVLEYLRDQKDSPDRELMDKLGWEPKDIDNFLKRWQSLKEKAKGSEAQNGKRELDEVLSSMGLRPRKPTIHEVDRASDAQRGNRETGRRVKPPADVAEQYRQFLRSLQQTEPVQSR